MNGQPDPVDIYIGMMIMTMRKNRGWSQKRMGTALNISYQQIQKYETAKNRLPIATLLRIAKLFNLPPILFLPDDLDNPLGNNLRG